MMDVVIVNWNGGDQVLDCVRSLSGAGDVVSSVTVVDNASSDGSLTALSAIGGCRILPNSQNEGFGRACNSGAAGGKADFILLLNPDAAILPDTFGKLAEVVAKPENADVGVFGIRLQDETGETQRSCARFPDAGMFALDSLGVRHFFPKTKGMHMTDWDHNATCDVDHVIGAFYLIRRDLFAKLGGFDERFFVYLEDIDLSLRVHQAGYRIRYLSDIRAYHKGGGVSSQVKAARLFYSLRSRLIYARKHFSVWGARSVAAVTLGPEFFTRLAFLLLRGRVQEIGNLLAGYRALWSWALATGAGKRPSVRDREPFK